MAYTSSVSVVTHFPLLSKIIIQVARKGWLFYGIVILLLVGESGFEPLKDKPPDLQSGAFDQLGYSPIYGAQSETRTRTSRRTPVPETGAYTIPPSVHCGGTFRIRTRYAQDFNQPLYKLSEKRTGGVRAGPDAQSPLLNRPLSREVSIQSEYHFRIIGAGWRCRPPWPFSHPRFSGPVSEPSDIIRHDGDPGPSRTDDRGSAIRCLASWLRDQMVPG